MNPVRTVKVIHNHLDDVLKIIKEVANLSIDYDCSFCYSIDFYKHQNNCPVLLAKDILKEIEGE